MYIRLFAFFTLLFCSITAVKAQLQFINYPQPDGKVCDIELDTVNNIGYMCGYFDNVNGQPRSRIAAFNIATGALLNWKPTINETIGVAYEKMILTDTMIICLFSNNPGKIVFINRTNGSKRTIYQPSSAGIISDIALKDSLLFAVGDLDLGSGSLSEVAYFNINEQTSWPYNWIDIGITTDNHITNSTFISDIEFLHDTMYLMGKFNKLNNVARNNMASYKMGYDLINEMYTFTRLSLNPPNTINIGTASNYPYITSLFERTNNNLFFVSRAYQALQPYNERIINLNQQTSTVNASINDTTGIALSYFDVNFDRDGLIAKIKQNTFLKVGNYSNRYGNEVRYLNPATDVIGTKNIITSAGQKSVSGTPRDVSYISTLKKWKNYIIIGGLFDTINNIYARKSLACMCLAPILPHQFKAAKAAVCTNEKGIIYEFSQQDKSVSIASYTWTYSGTGVTMHINDTSAVLDFSNTATSGYLKVKAISSCGSYSDSLMTYITVYPQPQNNITSPLHTVINCTQPIAPLVGTTISAGSSTIMQWNQPNNTIYPNSTLNTSVPGRYIFETVSIFTNPDYTCSDKDTLILTIDTVKPVITQPTVIPIITCTLPSIQLTAQTTNTNDSIAWQKSTGVYLPDPITVTSASAYSLIALNTNNGCSATKAIQVNDNVVKPKINITNTNDTLTCRKDSTILSGSSSSSNTLLFWTQDSVNIGNNITVRESGIYVFNVIDTINGCTSVLPFYLPEYKTLPQISVLNDSANITCSHNTTILNATIQSSYTTATWRDSTHIGYPNPATVHQLGMYYVTATKQDNGCTITDSILVNYVPLLDISVNNDTTVCKGSAVDLKCNVIKGAADTLTYTWNNISYTDSIIKIYPIQTSKYSLYVSSANGCYGTDSLIVIVPIDIVTTATAFKLCTIDDNGIIQLNTTGGVAPYVYALDSLNYQSSNEFNNLALGNYTITTQDVMGCKSTITSTIANTTQLPTPKFLVKTFSQLGDTIAIIDLSSPKPDSIQWIFPPQIKILNNNNLNTPIITCADSGRYIIGMLAYYGVCNTLFSKEIFFGLIDTTLATNKPHNGIESIITTPNPSTGIFEMQLRFYKKQPFSATISDVNGHVLYTHSNSNEDILYVENIDFATNANGIYLLNVVTPYDAQQHLIIISK